MRKIILAGAAMLATTGMAMAAEGTVELTGSVPLECKIGASIAKVAFEEDDTSKVGSFTTNCNYSNASMTVSFKSDNGGLLNEDEEVLAPYVLSYGTVDKESGDILETTEFVTEPAGIPRNANKTRNFTVTLVDPLTVGGEYEDIITITVTP